MPNHNAKRTTLLQEGFAAVLRGDTNQLLKTANTMGKDESYWVPLLKEVCFDNMSADDATLLKTTENMDDAASKLFMNGTSKNLLERVPLGVIELRDNPIERLSYKGALGRKNRIASLLVLAGYSEPVGFNSFAETQAMLNERAENAVHPVLVQETVETIDDMENFDVNEVEPEVEDTEQEDMTTLETLMTPRELLVEDEAETAVDPVEASETVDTEEPLKETSQEPQEDLLALWEGATTVPDITDPEVYKELREKVEFEINEDRKRSQWAAFVSLNPFKKRVNNTLVEDIAVSAPHRITVVQEVTPPGALPADTVIETNVVNDDEDEVILAEEWSSIEELFAERPNAA